MSEKSNTHKFQVSLTWLHEKKGLLTSEDAIGSLQVETPPAFGGKGKPWTPEHLLLGAVSSCFMTTYIAFAEKFKIPIEGINCPVTGVVELVNGKFAITRIDVYPEVTITDERLEEKAKLAMEKSHKYCLVANCLNTEVVYHSEVKLMQIAI